MTVCILLIPHTVLCTHMCSYTPSKLELYGGVHRGDVDWQKQAYGEEATESVSQSSSRSPTGHHGATEAGRQGGTGTAIRVRSKKESRGGTTSLQCYL